MEHAVVRRPDAPLKLDGIETRTQESLERQAAGHRRAAGAMELKHARKRVWNFTEADLTELSGWMELKHARKRVRNRLHSTLVMVWNS